MEQEKNGTAAAEQTLAQLELELQERYTQIGKSFLEIAACEQDEVNLLVDKIIHTRKELTLIRQDIQCPGCLSYNSSNSQFCHHCGQKLPK